MFADKAREYRVKNWISVQKRIVFMLRDAGLVPQAIPPRLFLPALDAASVEDDSYLQEKWAALLANAATPDGPIKVSPAFIGILKELSPDDASLFDAIFEKSYAVKAQRVSPELMAGSEGELEKLFWGRSDFLVAFRNLQRLGLIQEELGKHYRKRKGVEKPKDPDDVILVDVSQAIYVTAFGLAFLRACRPPGGT
jgi:hypothetical protein